MLLSDITIQLITAVASSHTPTCAHTHSQTLTRTIQLITAASQLWTQTQLELCVRLKRGTQSLRTGQLALCDWLPWETDCLPWCCGFKLRLVRPYHVHTSTPSLSVSWKNARIFQQLIFGSKWKLLIKGACWENKLCSECVVCVCSVVLLYMFVTVHKSREKTKTNNALVHLLILSDFLSVALSSKLTGPCWRCMFLKT